MSKVLGIDFGMTNYCVAVIENNNPLTIPSAEGLRTTPCEVAFSKNHFSLVGVHAKHAIADAQMSVISSVRRRLGTSYEWAVGSNMYSATDVAKIIFQKIKNDSETFLKEKIEQAVLTVPTYFSSHSIGALVSACKSAGIDVIGTIQEPVAATLAYGMNNSSKELILVCHLGGCSFNATVLSISNKEICVLATSPEYYIGGNSFDKRIVDYLTDAFLQKSHIDVKSDKSAMKRITNEAERIKIELSENKEVTINLPFLSANANGPQSLNTILSRQTFETLISDIIQHTTIIANDTIRDAKISKHDLTKILLVGGMARVPAVQRAMNNFAGRSVFLGRNPDECYAIGAAKYAKKIQTSTQNRTVSKGESIMYDVVLSFAGEERNYVEQVAYELKKRNVKVFYDKDEQSILWGENLYEKLSDIYRSAHFCVVFVSKNYARKRWTRHELRSAEARAFEEKSGYILPALFDDTEISGILPTTGYIDLRITSPYALADAICQKLTLK